MTASSWRLLMALLLFAIAAAGWAAEPRVLVVREDTTVAGQAAELLERELPRAGFDVRQTIILERGALPGIDSNVMVIALGARAYAVAVKAAAGRPVIGALLTRAAVDEISTAVGDRWSAIVLDQPVDRWGNLIEAAFPGQSNVGLLMGRDQHRSLKSLEQRLAERRIHLLVESIISPEDVVPALERLMPRVGLLLALPDPVAHNRNTVQPLLLTTYRAGIPVVAYSEAYQRAGAVLALYSTMPQIAAQIVETLRQFRDAKVPPNIQAPRYYTVGINSAVARSLGLRLPAAGELLERLRALDQ